MKFRDKGSEQDTQAEMAGIVAQFTKANWERLKRQQRYLPPDKSVYFIPPFDPAFDPERHNVFARRKAQFERMHRQVGELSFCLKPTPTAPPTPTKICLAMGLNNL